jgi:hypothetical protein
MVNSMAPSGSSRHVSTSLIQAAFGYDLRKVFALARAWSRGRENPRPAGPGHAVGKVPRSKGHVANSNI